MRQEPNCANVCVHVSVCARVRACVVKITSAVNHSFVHFVWKDYEEEDSGGVALRELNKWRVCCVSLLSSDATCSLFDPTWPELFLVLKFTIIFYDYSFITGFLSWIMLPSPLSSVFASTSPVHSEMSLFPHDSDISAHLWNLNFYVHPLDSLIKVLLGNHKAILDRSVFFQFQIQKAATGSLGVVLFSDQS